jgi:hypothetical protein
MIHNEQDYAITQAQARKFAEALTTLEQTPPQGHPKRQQAYKDALRSQLEDLQTQLSDYEASRATPSDP